MIDKTLAIGYLQALFELARSKDQFQQVTGDLEVVAELFRQNEKLKKIFQNMQK